jgi:hypothetical protein
LVPTLFPAEMTEILDRLAAEGEVKSSSELLTSERRESLIAEIVSRSTAALAAGVLPAASMAGLAGAPRQDSLFPSAEEAATPIDTEEVVRNLRRRAANAVDALALQIDVPDIRAYSNPRLVLDDFSPRPSSDFSAVEQRLRSAGGFGDRLVFMHYFASALFFCPPGKTGDGLDFMHYFALAAAYRPNHSRFASSRSRLAASSSNPRSGSVIRTGAPAG